MKRIWAGNRRRVTLGILAVFLCGCFTGCLMRFNNAKADKTAYKELEKFSKILEYIEANYVEEAKPVDLIEGAIKGMLDTLDPHSAYLTPDVYREMKVETSGKFGGLGIEVSIQDGIITVVSPIDDTPAFRAGIKAGDRIISIAGKSTKTITLPEAVTLMRGKPGSKIQIKLIRKGVKNPIEYNLARESIKMQSVRSMKLGGGLGYLRISSFMERTAEDLSKAIDKVSEGGKLNGIVLDLRGNPGGLLDQAVRVVNLFVDEGPVVFTIGRDKTKKDVDYAQKGRMKTDAPMVVLVDGASASASEIVAGALQDYGRAVLAGTKTFGKGSVQTIIPMGDEAGLKLTIARYYTPSGRSIQARGITPDVELEYIDPAVVEAARQRSHRLREADLEGHFANEAGGSEEEDADPIDETMPPPPPSMPPPSHDAGHEKPPPPPPVLSLEERIKKDYMVIQAEGILKTMAVVRGGVKKPEFKLDEGTKKPDANADIDKGAPKKDEGNDLSE